MVTTVTMMDHGHGNGHYRLRRGYAAMPDEG